MRALILGCFLCASALGCDYTPIGDNWREIKTAPHVSTVELFDATQPWYGLYRWRAGRWDRISAGGDGHWRIKESGCLFWRPYVGRLAEYKDPTGGGQVGNHRRDAVGMPGTKRTEAIKELRSR